MPQNVCSAAQLWQTAQTLVDGVFEENDKLSPGLKEANLTQRHKLQMNLESLLLCDLDYGIGKQAEIAMWNNCYKLVIDAYQTKLRRHRTEADTAMYNMFLWASLGSLEQFHLRLCSIYNIASPNFMSPSALGVLNAENDVECSRENKQYMAHFCLIHLGDICRYQRNLKSAQIYYLRAAEVHPDSGHPWNQMGILQTSRGHSVSATCYYVRSLNSSIPFAPAAANLEKFYSHLSSTAIETLQISPSTLPTIYLHLHAHLHLCSQLEPLDALTPRIADALPQSLSEGHVTGTDWMELFSLDVAGIYKLRTENTGSRDEMLCYRMLCRVIGDKLENAVGYFVGKVRESEEWSSITEWTQILYLMFEWLLALQKNELASILNENMDLMKNTDHICSILKLVDAKQLDKKFPALNFNGFAPLAEINAWNKVTQIGNHLAELLKSLCDRRNQGPESTLPEITSSPTRKSKVVPLMRILERPADQTEIKPETEVETTEEEPSTSKPSKGVLKVKLPPEEKSDSKKSSAPKFQASKLKQALTGNVSTAPSVPVVLSGPSATNVPFPAFPMRPPPVWNQTQMTQQQGNNSQRPPMPIPPFPRTPGNRGPAPPQFPPPPMTAVPVHLPPPPLIQSHMFPPTADPYFNLWRDSSQSANESWSSGADDSGDPVRGLEYMPFSTTAPSTRPPNTSATQGHPQSAASFSLFGGQQQWYQNWSSQDGR